MKGKTGTATIWNKNFICVLLANMFLGFSNSSVNTLVSTFADFLGAGAVLVGALTGMYFGVSFLMRPVAGPVTTRFDKRNLMILAFALGMLANLGYAFTRSVGLFVVFRILTGMQFSIIGPLAMTVASDSLPPEKLGSGLGFYGVAMAISSALGPSIGIWLKDSGTALKGESFGFLLVFLFASLCLGIAVIPSLLIRIPKKTKAELADIGVWYKNIVAVPALPPALIILFVSTAHSMFSAYMYPYAKELGVAGIGSFFTVYAVVLLAARPLSGRMIDKYGAFKLIFIGSVIFALSFVFVGISRSLASLLCAAFVAAVGYGTAQPAIQTMCMQSVAPVKRAVASNTIYVGMDLGLFAGPLIGGVIYSLAGSYSVTYLAMAIPLCAAMLVLKLSWKYYEKSKRRADGEQTVNKDCAE